MEEAGKIQLKIYVLCSSERNASKLESLVTHILARQGHAYWLKWHDGLDALNDLLMVAPYLYRYVDTSIEPCFFLEDILKAHNVMPTVPKFLTAKANFQTMIETGQQLGACSKFGSGSAGEGQTGHPGAQSRGQCTVLHFLQKDQARRRIQREKMRGLFGRRKS